MKRMKYDDGPVRIGFVISGSLVEVVRGVEAKLPDDLAEKLLSTPGPAKWKVLTDAKEHAQRRKPKKRTGGE